jgi:hypothetical protein
MSTSEYTLVGGQQTDGTWVHTGKLIVSRKLDNGTVASVTLPDTTGPVGPQGPPGATGPAGAAGPGVATGGTTGQVLTKNTATNYDTGWTTPLSQATADARYLQLSGGTLTGPLVAGTFTEIAEIATPATPAAGKVRLYAKADHHLYILDSTGVERMLDINTLEGNKSYA